MAHLIPVQYKGLMYPPDVKPKVGEIPLRFNASISRIKKSIADMKKNGVEYFSLHTQEPYSTDNKVREQILNAPDSVVTEREFVNLAAFPTSLWSSKEWIDEFITFLEIASESFEDNNIVRVIELHAPDVIDISSVVEFMDELTYFHDAVSHIFPKAEFVVENSNINNRKLLLLSSVNEINEFSDKIDELKVNNYKFGIALDIPQLLQAEGLRNINAEGNKIENLFRNLMRSKHNIRSIHLSGANGEGPDGKSHHGDLDSLFHHGHPGTDEEIQKVRILKQSLLNGLNLILSDERKRYLVPELNGDPDNAVGSILRDIMAAGINFDYSLP